MDGAQVVMFPGVGAHYEEMLPTYLSAYPEDGETIAHWVRLLDAPLGRAAPRDAYERERVHALEIHALNLLWWRRTSSRLRRPAVCGHGLGYYAALVASGVIDEETSLRLVDDVVCTSWRHPIVCDTDKLIFGITTKNDYPFDSTLASVGAEMIGENGLRQRVMYGARRQYDEIVGRINGSLLAAPIIPTRIPFHSAKMYPLRTELAVRIEKLAIEPSDPKLPLWSHVNGRPICSGEEAMRVVVDQSYQCVQWMLLVDRLIQAGRFDFIEVGPNRRLSQAVRLISPQLSVEFVDRLRGCASAGRLRTCGAVSTVYPRVQ